MKEKDLNSKLVEELEKLETVKKVEIVPVCEIHVDSCIKIFVTDKSQSTKLKIADVILNEARKEAERLGFYPEIYWDLEVEA